MKRELLEMNEKSVREGFEKQTGIPHEEITEILECFPMDRHITIHTIDRTFEAKLTFGGRLQKDSVKEEL